MVDLTAGLLTQIAFAALGIALLARLLGQAGELIAPALGLVLLGLLLLGFAGAQRRGLFALLARPLARLARRPGWRAWSAAPPRSTPRSRCAIAAAAR